MKISRLGTTLIGGAFAIVMGLPAGASAQAPEAKIDTGPRLDFPAGLATDGVSLYVANSRNNTIDKVDLTAHTISLVAGTMFKEGSADGPGPQSLFTSPSGLALVGSSLYVSDTNNSTVRVVALPGGMVTTGAGAANIPGTDDGKSASAHFNLPTQIAPDPNGSRLFVTDTNNSIIRMISLPDMVVKTIAGQPGTDGKEDGGATDAQFNNPGAMATDGANVYVLDADNHAVRKIEASTGAVTKVTLVNGHIGSGCAISKDGKILYFSDTTENSVQQVDLSNGNVSPVYPLQ